MRLRLAINEVRDKELSIYDALENIKKECSDAWKSFNKGKYLYRGSSGSTTGARYYSGRKGRVSANTLNYYTLFIDNHPQWKKYPKRSESFICTTDDDYAEAFGDVMYVFPKDGTTFGVCPAGDLWLSFDKTIGAYYKGQAGDILYDIEHVAEMVGAGHSSRPDTYRGLVALFKEIDEGWTVQDKGDRWDIIDAHSFMKRYKGNFMDLFKDIFDPKKNGFKTMKSIGTLPQSNEVWFSGPNYQISVEDLTRHLDFETTDMMS